jgi:phosphatidylglycerol:prolipoprotein diacylglycerol transferase
VHKVAFELGPITVHWYGVLVAAGFLTGIWTASRRGMREGITPETIMDLGPWLIIGALLGARLWYVASYWRQDFAGRPIWAIFNMRQGGLVFYGGLVGASLSYILYAKLKKLPLWKVADILAPSIALGQSFGRVGCLMTGCCYGRPTDLPWAIRFPLDHQTLGAPVHPTQIYESSLNLGLYLFLAWLYRRKKFDGQIFATYLICYAVLRSFVEFFRGDYPQYYGGVVTPAHIVSFAILATGLVLWWQLGTRVSTRPGL